MKKKGTLLHKDAPFQGGVPTTWRGRAHQSTRRPGGAISLLGSLLQFGKSRTPLPSLTREHSRRPGQQLCRAMPCREALRTLAVPSGQQEQLHARKGTWHRNWPAGALLSTGLRPLWDTADCWEL